MVYHFFTSGWIFRVVDRVSPHLIFSHIAAIALATHFHASFGFATAFQGPRIPTFMDPRCERKLEERSGEKTPPPRDPRSACRREEAKVKTALAVSDQVLLRPQTEMLHCEGRSSSAAAHWSHAPMVIVVRTESTMDTLNALKFQ